VHQTVKEVVQLGCVLLQGGSQDFIRFPAGFALVGLGVLHELGAGKQFSTEGELHGSHETRVHHTGNLIDANGHLAHSLGLFRHGLCYVINQTNDFFGSCHHFLHGFRSVGHFWSCFRRFQDRHRPNTRDFRKMASSCRPSQPARMPL